MRPKFVIRVPNHWLPKESRPNSGPSRGLGPSGWLEAPNGSLPREQRQSAGEIDFLADHRAATGAVGVAGVAIARLQSLRLGQLRFSFGE
jgi:hypothetical protein